MKKQRAFILILDMLAGHWVKGVTVPSTKLPPVNVLDYSNAGLLPAFRDTIDKGVFVHAWNSGICNTPHGQKYLASGTYKSKSVPGIDPYWKMIEGSDCETILSACKKTYPESKVAAFGSNAWMQSGWWKAPDCTMGWGSYYSDLLTSEYCFKWMLENPDWDMTLLYLAKYDQTGNCPLYKKGAKYTEDKHHSIIELDRYLWLVKRFLEEKGWWDETYLFIGSDHGCHYGCDVAVKEGRKRGIPEKELPNYCSNHQEPHDCYVWDFKNNRASKTRSDCSRRVTFMAGGGKLPRKYYGKKISRGEIIDFAPTIADLMKIKFKCDGKSLI